MGAPGTGVSHRYGRRTWSDRNRPRVLDVAPGLIHESGPARGREWAPERVAVMAHWSADPIPSRSVVTMLQELDASGYTTLLVSAADVAGPIERTCTWAPGEPSLPEMTAVLRRANVGYDFGSWSSALTAFPRLAQAAKVLLVNDSMIGPLVPLAPVVTDFESRSSRAWGLIRSDQHRPHLQSFFLGFQDGVLDSGALRAFWADIRVETRKSRTVRYGELALSEVLDEAGIEWQTMFAPDAKGPVNPTMKGAAHLLHRGFPFVKANGVPDGPVAERLREWLPRGAEMSPSGDSSIVERLRFRLDIEGLAWDRNRRWGRRTGRSTGSA